RLPDGSILYVNAATRATLEAPRRLKLTAGEIYLEAASPPAEKPEAPFVVSTPNREVSGRGAHLAVRIAKADTAVLVTRGQAQVSGLDRPVRAGQRVPRAQPGPEPAPAAPPPRAWPPDPLTPPKPPLAPPPTPP